MILQRLEHFVRDFFGNVAPEGNDLVVALAVSDRTVQILLLHLDDFALRGVDKFYLVARDADGDAGLSGVGKAQLLQLVKQHNGAFETVVQIGEVHQLLHAFFLE